MNQQTVSFSIGVPMPIPFERQSFMGKTIFIVHFNTYNESVPNMTWEQM